MTDAATLDQLEARLAESGSTIQLELLAPVGNGTARLYDGTFEELPGVLQ